MGHTILLLTALILFPLSHAEGKAKVFILSGQSNMSDTDDLSQRDDLVHFDQEGQLGLGKRFGEAMIKALK